MSSEFTIYYFSNTEFSVLEFPKLRLHNLLLYAICMKSWGKKNKQKGRCENSETKIFDFQINLEHNLVLKGERP